MKTAAKPKTTSKTGSSVRKPEGTPKIVLGTGRNLGYISDTLFDEDLKR
jgi:hypothetical protein